MKFDWFQYPSCTIFIGGTDLNKNFELFEHSSLKPDCVD